MSCIKILIVGWVAVGQQVNQCEVVEIIGKTIDNQWSSCRKEPWERDSKELLACVRTSMEAASYRSRDTSQYA